MDVYELPWFDPLEEAEARAEAVEDSLRAGADTLNKGGRAGRIKVFRHAQDEAQSVAPTAFVVPSLEVPSGRLSLGLSEHHSMGCSPRRCDLAS